MVEHSTHHVTAADSYQLYLQLQLLPHGFGVARIQTCVQHCVWHSTTCTDCGNLGQLHFLQHSMEQQLKISVETNPALTVTKFYSDKGRQALRQQSQATCV